MNKGNKKILVTGGMLMLAMLVWAIGSEAVAFHRSPENITVDFFITRDNYTHEKLAEIDLENVDVVIVDDIEFESEYVLDYTPLGTLIEPDTKMLFTLKIGISDIEQAATVNAVINVTGQPEGSEDREVVAQIPLYINVDAEIESLEDYIYKKCFVEDNIEYCAEINASDLAQNITIINLTQENQTFNVMLPYNLTTEYFDKYDKTLDDTTKRLELIADAVLNQTRASMELENQKNRNYQNAFLIEAYMKMPANPLWFEISPVNTLQNLTGLDTDQMENALSVLFEQGNVVQRIEEEMKVLPLKGGGALTTIIKKTYIASSERIEEERVVSTSMTLAYSAIFIMFASGFSLFIYRTRLSKKPRWK